MAKRAPQKLPDITFDEVCPHCLQRFVREQGCYCCACDQLVCRLCAELSNEGPVCSDCAACEVEN